MYPLNHTIKPATLKTHLQEQIPGARVEIVGRHKGGGFEAECTIDGDVYGITLTKVTGGYTYRIETPRVWAESDFDYESEDEMHNRNRGKISDAVKKLLTK